MDHAPHHETQRAERLASSALALAQVAARLDVPMWQAGQLACSLVPTASTGWLALDAELPGGGWPLAGLCELLVPPASGELALLLPWLAALGRRQLGPRELVWVAAPARPSAAALRTLGLDLPRLLLVEPASSKEAAWAVEQALRAGSCAAVLWWTQRLDEALPPPVPLPTWRRLHLAALAGATPLIALRPLATRGLGSPAPLRLMCVPATGQRLSVEVFKRRGPPMAGALHLDLPWPASVRRALRLPGPRTTPSEVLTEHPPTAPGPSRPVTIPSAWSLHRALDRPAPAAPAAASPASILAGA